jgi:hypothetical protein
MIMVADPLCRNAYGLGKGRIDRELRRLEIADCIIQQTLTAC